jgi:transposase
MRSIGMDVHRDFCEVAIAQDGAVRSAARVKTDPATLELFARSLVDTDEVVLEATANALAIARIIEPHVQRVVLANPKTVRESSRRAKTDRIDARVLAQLLAVGFLDEVWTPDEKARTRRRLISRRCALVRARTRDKNQVHAVLQRNLIERPPVSDLFGVRGRRWLAERLDRLPLDEQRTVQAGLRQIDFTSSEIDQLDKILGADAISDPDALRLMTLQGVSLVTAIAVLGAIGDIRRFKTPRHLVAYLGLDPRVRQSGNEPAKHGQDQQARPRRRARPARRSGLARRAQRRSAARLSPAHRRTTRLERRDGRDRPQDGRDRLASAQPRPGLCLRAPCAGAREDPPPRVDARRAAPPGALRDRTRAPKDPPAPSRTRGRRASRAGVSPAGRRLAKLKAEGGRGRDTGARISKALEGQSRAADSVKPQGLRFASSVTRAQNRVSHRGAPASSQLDFHP